MNNGFFNCCSLFFEMIQITIHIKEKYIINKEYGIHSLQFINENEILENTHWKSLKIRIKWDFSRSYFPPCSYMISTKLRHASNQGSHSMINSFCSSWWVAGVSFPGLLFYTVSNMIYWVHNWIVNVLEVLGNNPCEVRACITMH